MSFHSWSDPDAQISDTDLDHSKVLGAGIVVCLFQSKGRCRFWLMPAMPWTSTVLGWSGLSLFSALDQQEQGRKDLIFVDQSKSLTILSLKLSRFIKQLIYSLTCLNLIGFLYLLRPAAVLWQVLDSQSMLWVFMVRWASGSISSWVSVKGGIPFMQFAPTKSRLTGVSQV